MKTILQTLQQCENIQLPRFDSSKLPKKIKKIKTIEPEKKRIRKCINSENFYGVTPEINLQLKQLSKQLYIDFFTLTPEDIDILIDCCQIKKKKGTIPEIVKFLQISSYAFDKQFIIEDIIRQRFADFGYFEEDYEKVIKYLMEQAPICVKFIPKNHQQELNKALQANNDYFLPLKIQKSNNQNIQNEDPNRINKQQTCPSQKCKKLYNLKNQESFIHIGGKSNEYSFYFTRQSYIVVNKQTRIRCLLRLRQKMSTQYQQYTTIKFINRLLVNLDKYQFNDFVKYVCYSNPEWKGLIFKVDILGRINLSTDVDRIYLVKSDYENKSCILLSKMKDRLKISII